MNRWSSCGAVSRLFNWIVALFTAGWLLSPAGSTCSDEQYYTCQKAAVEGTMSSLISSGVCQSKPYIQFTHICSVKNYMPTVDYCCCSLRPPAEPKETLGQVMCCRYHQDWNHFRCAEPEDIVNTAELQSGERNVLPIELVVLSTVGPLIVLVCCIACFIKCCCYRYDGDSELWFCHYCRQEADTSTSSKSVLSADNISSVYDERSCASIYCRRTRHPSVVPCAGLDSVRSLCHRHVPVDCYSSRGCHCVHHVYDCDIEVGQCEWGTGGHDEALGSGNLIGSDSGYSCEFLVSRSTSGGDCQQFSGLDGDVYNSRSSFYRRHLQRQQHQQQQRSGYRRLSCRSQHRPFTAACQPVSATDYCPVPPPPFLTCQLCASRLASLQQFVCQKADSSSQQQKPFSLPALPQVSALLTKPCQEQPPSAPLQCLTVAEYSDRPNCPASTTLEQLTTTSTNNSCTVQQSCCLIGER